QAAKRSGFAGEGDGSGTGCSMAATFSCAGGNAFSIQRQSEFQYHVTTIPSKGWNPIEQEGIATFQHFELPSLSYRAANHREELVAFGFYLLEPRSKHLEVPLSERLFIRGSLLGAIVQPSTSNAQKPVLSPWLTKYRAATRNQHPCNLRRRHGQ